MAKAGEDYRLIGMIFGERAGQVAVVAGTRLLRWAKAFEAWAREREGCCTRETARRSVCAWRDFLRWCGTMPWEVSQAQVQDYKESCLEQGLMAYTVSRRLYELERFYTWCAQREVDPACGPDFNPVREVKKPRVQPYEHGGTLTAEQARVLLGAIERETPIGKRDYALFLARLSMGWPMKEIREMRWQGECAGEAGLPEELPEFVRQAILEYLQAAGRLKGMREGEFIFAPLADPLRWENSGKAEEWNGSRPISEDQVLRLLKVFGRWAGLERGKLTLITLKHTAVQLRMEAGEDLEGIQHFLGRSSRADTRKYLRALGDGREIRNEETGIRDNNWLTGVKSTPKDLATDMRGAEGEGKSVAGGQAAGGQAAGGQADGGQVKHERGPSRARAGNRLALKHGLYAQFKMDEEVAAILAEGWVGVAEEMGGLRWMARKLLAMMGEGKYWKDRAALGDAYSLAVSRAGLIKRSLKELGEDKVAARMEQTIADIEEGIRRMGNEADFRQTLIDYGKEKARKARQAQEQAGKEVIDLEEEENWGEEGVAAMRLVLSRMLELAVEEEDAQKMISLADRYGKTAVRMVKVLKEEQVSMAELERLLNEMVREAIDEALEGWGWKGFEPRDG
jgi:site-specific recombinase XerD